MKTRNMLAIAFIFISVVFSGLWEFLFFAGKKSGNTEIYRVSAEIIDKLKPKTEFCKKLESNQ